LIPSIVGSIDDSGFAEMNLSSIPIMNDDSTFVFPNDLLMAVASHNLIHNSSK
jgi:hypothetical protein